MDKGSRVADRLGWLIVRSSLSLPIVKVGTSLLIAWCACYVWTQCWRFHQGIIAIETLHERINTLSSERRRLAASRYDPRHWIAESGFQVSPYLRASLEESGLPGRVLRRVDPIEERAIDGLCLVSYRLELTESLTMSDLVRWLVKLESGSPRLVVKRMRLSAADRSSVTNDRREKWFVDDVVLNLLISR